MDLNAGQSPRWMHAGLMLLISDQWCLRTLLGIKRHQFVRNEELKRITKQPNLTLINNPATASLHWEPTSLHWTKQSIWLRTVLCGGWCLRMALCTPSGACQKRRRRKKEEACACTYSCSPLWSARYKFSYYYYYYQQNYRHPLAMQHDCARDMN